MTKLLRALPADFPVPIAVVLHLPVGYTAPFAARLDGDCALRVCEAEHGIVLAPGVAVVAPAGLHLEVHDRGGVLVAATTASPTDSLHRPSVDVLFASAAAAAGAATLGVVLTGMGDDGLRGAHAIRAAGGAVLTETEGSCVVYGMPRVVYEAGLADAEAPIGRMAAEIGRFL